MHDFFMLRPPTVPRNIDKHSRGLRKARPVVHPRRPANSARVDWRHGVSPWSPRLHTMLVLTAAKVAVAFDGHHTGNALHAPLGVLSASPPNATTHVSCDSLQVAHN